jgi:anaerobic selenocysteine-containing dehydrogenase
MRAALESLDTLVVVDVHDGELCELATHALPATGQLERADLSMFAQMSMASTVQYTDAVVAPVGERRPVWWILGQLSRRLGADLLHGVDPDAMTDQDFLRSLVTGAPLDVDEVIAHGPRGVAVPVEVGWVHDELLVDGCWNVAPSALVARLDSYQAPEAGLLLTTRREMGWINSTRYGGRGNDPVVRMHPDDLADIEVSDGGDAHVRSAHGSLRVTVAADPGVRRGVVSMTHGHRDASPGALISTVADVDPLTAMPRASALPVTVEPVALSEGGGLP